MSDDSYFLAKKICACKEVEKSKSNTNHPCHEIVAVQNIMVRDNEELRQRPEPWIGNLATAKVLFISSNPSISDDPDFSTREDFPTFAKSIEESADFFINRFSPEVQPPHATFNTVSKVDFLYRCNDGAYRGQGGKSKPVVTWHSIHQRAKEILGENCHPDVDYALTEVVKCKSKAEVGVKKASLKCVDAWMAEVFMVSTASIVVVVGRHSRDNFAHKIEGITSDFGTDSKTYAELGPYLRSRRDIKISHFAGKPRIYVYNWHPTSYIPEKKDMLQLRKVYGDKIVNFLSEVTSHRVEVPQTNEELLSIVDKIFDK